MAVVAVYGAFGFLLSLVMLFSLQSWTPPASAGEWAMLIGIGFLGFLAQWLLNGGMQREQAGIGSLMRNIDVACAFLWQATILQQEVSLWAVGGALLVLSGAGWVMWQKARGNQNTPKTNRADDQDDEAPAERMRNIPHTPLKNTEEEVAAEWSHRATAKDAQHKQPVTPSATMGSSKNSSAILTSEAAEQRGEEEEQVQLNRAVFEIGPSSDSEDND